MFVPKLLKDLLSSLGVEVSKGVEDELGMSSEETDSFTMVVGVTDVVAIHPKVRQMGITYSADAAALHLRAEAMGAQGDQKRLYGLAGKRLEKALTVQTNDGRLYWQRANVMTLQEGSTGNTRHRANTHFEIAANLISDPTDRAKMLSDWGWVLGGWVSTPTLTAVRIHFIFPIPSFPLIIVHSIHAGETKIGRIQVGGSNCLVSLCAIRSLCTLFQEAESKITPLSLLMKFVILT